MIHLTPLRSLAPVSAASGLARVGDRWCVVADDALALAAFPVADPEAPAAMLRLFDGTLPAEPRARKRAKPDLESLAPVPAFDGHPHGALLALGSGSRPNRARGAVVPLLAGPAGPTLPPFDADPPGRARSTCRASTPRSRRAWASSTSRASPRRATRSCCCSAATAATR